MKSHLPAVLAQIRQHIIANLHGATIVLAGQVKVNLSRAGRRGTKAGAKRLRASGDGISNRSVRYRYSAKGNLLGFQASSRPGEYPRRQTGRLRSSISRDVDTVRLAAAVGTNVEYAKYLESPRLQRQFLTRTLREMLPQLRDRLLRRMP